MKGDNKTLWRNKARAYHVLANAIKEKCRDSCCVGDILSWKECTSKDTCPLWKYRGGLPNHSKTKIQKDSNNLRRELQDFSQKKGIQADTLGQEGSQEVGE